MSWSDHEREISRRAVREFARGLLQYVEDGNVIELRECDFVQELLEAAGYFNEEGERVGDEGEGIDGATSCH